MKNQNWICDTGQLSQEVWIKAFSAYPSNIYHFKSLSQTEKNNTGKTRIKEEDGMSHACVRARCSEMMRSRHVSKVCSPQTPTVYQQQIKNSQKAPILHFIASLLQKKERKPAAQQINTNEQDDQESVPTQRKRANEIHDFGTIPPNSKLVRLKADAELFGRMGPVCCSPNLQITWTTGYKTLLNNPWNTPKITRASS